MFKLEIELGNDAMQDREDVASALRKAAEKIEQTSAALGRIIDENGNTVGTWDFDG